MRVEQHFADKTVYTELTSFVEEFDQMKANTQMANRLLVILVDTIIWPRNEGPKPFDNVVDALNLIDRAFPGCIISHQKNDALFTVAIQPRGWKASIRRHDHNLCIALCHSLALTKWHELGGEGAVQETAPSNVLPFGKRTTPPICRDVT